MMSAIYPVMYDILLRLNSYTYTTAVVVLAWLTVIHLRKKVRSQKIDDLPVLPTRRSGTSAMLSSKVDGLVAHGSTS